MQKRPSRQPQSHAEEIRVTPRAKRRAQHENVPISEVAAVKVPRSAGRIGSGRPHRTEKPAKAVRGRRYGIEPQRRKKPPETSVTYVREWQNPTQRARLQAKSLQRAETATVHPEKRTVPVENRRNSSAGSQKVLANQMPQPQNKRGSTIQRAVVSSPRSAVRRQKRQARPAPFCTRRSAGEEGLKVEVKARQRHRR